MRMNFNLNLVFIFSCFSEVLDVMRKSFVCLFVYVRMQEMATALLFKHSSCYISCSALQPCSLHCGLALLHLGYLFFSICPQVLSSCRSMSSSTWLRLPCGWSWRCFRLTAPEVRGDEMDGAHGQTNAPAPASQHVQPQQVSPQLWRR